MAELNSEKAESSPASSDIHLNNNLESALHLPVNPLNAELNPICKSQLAKLFCGVFKFCAWFLKNLNISRTKQNKFVKQKAFCGKENIHSSGCLRMLYYPYRVMQKNCFWKKLVNVHVLLLILWSRLQLFVRRTDKKCLISWSLCDNP